MSPRGRGAARDAGAKLERRTAEFLAHALADDRIERRTRNGAKDRGDVGGVRTRHGKRLVIECKDVKTTSLGAWVDEAEVERGNDDAVVGVVVHKRRGRGIDTLDGIAGQFVTMTLADLAALLTGERPAVELVVDEVPGQDGPDLLDVLGGTS